VSMTNQKSPSSAEENFFIRELRELREEETCFVAKMGSRNVIKSYRSTENVMS